jgi:DNA-binding beta-propeller fold protein YncE
MRLTLIAALGAVWVSSATADAPEKLGDVRPLPDAAALDFGGFDQHAFVANRTSPEIAIIDTRTDEVAGRLTLADIPHQFVISGTRGKLVASHLATRRVTVFDLRTMAIEAVLELGFRPEQLTLDPSGRTFAVSSGVDDRVSVISLQPVEEMFRLSDLGQPSGLLFSRDTRLLYVASGSAPRIAVIDAWTGSPLEPMLLEQPKAAGIVRLQSAGPLGFALHGEGGEISVFDLRERSAIATLVVPGPANRAFPTDDGTQILLPNERDRSVSIIATQPTRHLREAARLPGAAGISGINTGMFGSVAFALSREHNRAVVLDLDDRRVADEIALPSQPETAISADAGRKLYVALSGTHQVAVIDMQKRTLVKLIDGVGREPWGINMAGALSYCH